MSRIRLDTVLTRDDTDDVVAAVAELGTKRQLSGDGVSQSREGIRQFRFATDELNGWWTIAFDNGERQEFRDRIYNYRGNRTGESRSAEYFGSMPRAMQMLWPTRLLVWGKTRGSFYPVLAQHVGRHSILLTFEHVDDPAFRQTLVLDDRSGIATRLIGYDYAVMVTSVAPLDAWNPAQQPTFEPITAPIAPDY